MGASNTVTLTITPTDLVRLVKLSLAEITESTWECDRVIQAAKDGNADDVSDYQLEAVDRRVARTVNHQRVFGPVDAEVDEKTRKAVAAAATVRDIKAAGVPNES